MPRLVNAYSIRPSEIAPGDEMCFIVKAMVSQGPDGTLLYRLYRCPWSGDINAMPQGARIDDEGIVCRALFPSLAAVANPD